MKTKCVFRVDKENELTAVFIEELGTPNLNISCYAHIGQHGVCCIHWLYQDTRPATEAEYTSLKQELETQIGYDLEVLNRLPSFRETISILKKQRSE